MCQRGLVVVQSEAVLKRYWVVVPLLAAAQLSFRPFPTPSLWASEHELLVASKIAYLNPSKVSQKELLRAILDAENYYGISHDVLLAVGLVESNFDPNAKSPRDAHGLMQIRPETALGHWQEFVSTLPEGHELKEVDPVVNHLSSVNVSVLFGAFYLNLLKQSMGNNLELALASYNVGPNRLKRALRQDGKRLGSAYVKKVMTAMNSIKSYRSNL